MTKTIKRGILVGLASGFVAMLFGGWSILALSILGGLLLGFTAGSLGIGGRAPSRRDVVVMALIFTVLTAIGGIIFDTGLADAAVMTDHPPEVTFPAAIIGIVLGTLAALGMAVVQALPDKRRVRNLNYAVFAAVIVIYPFVDQALKLNWAATIVFAGIYVLLSLGLDVVAGYAGLLNLGYAAFFGFGAYATALLSSNQLGVHVNFWLLLWVAAGVAALFGLALGAPTLGLKGDYIAIITLGFGEIVPVAFQQLIKITIKEPITCLILPAIQSIGGGQPTAQCLVLAQDFNLTAGVRGINPIDRPMLPIITPADSPLSVIIKAAVMVILIGLIFFFFRRHQLRGGMTLWKGLIYGLAAAIVVLLFVPIPHSDEGLLAPIWNTVQPGQFSSDNLLPWYFLLLALIGFVIFIKLRLKNSRLGRAWTAIREDELAANQMGVNLVHTKLTAFAVGAAFAGLAGAFYAAYVSAVFPDIFGFGASIIILSAIVLGGLGSIPGNILGAMIIFVADLLLLKQFQSLLNGLQTHVLMPSITDSAVRGFIQANLDPVKYRFLLLGLVLVLVMAFRPEGLLPTREQRMQFHAEEPPEEPEGKATPSAA
jgi:ABC-type branched-subunit amino acid transport system permease subunit